MKDQRVTETGTTTREPVEPGQLTLWGDSGTDLGPTTTRLSSPPSQRARWERPLSNDSNHAPVHERTTKSADRRLSDSHPTHRHLDRTSQHRDSADRSLHTAQPDLTADCLDNRKRLDRPPPAHLTRTDLLIEGPPLTTLPGLAGSSFEGCRDRTRPPLQRRRLTDSAWSHREPGA